jgi:hypothetical protein
LTVRLPHTASAFLAAALLAVAGGLASGPMTEEDVVRLYVAGRSVDEIVREIERREPGFELSPEMIDELHNVELPEVLIETMRRRQAAAERAEARTEQPEVAPAAPVPSLRIHLNPAHDRGPVTVGVRARIDPQVAAEWELGNAPEDRTFADVALFLVCQTADHVPDHWRLKSPLGRDFRSVTRHKVLAFIAGSGAEDADSGGRRVELKVPAELEVAVEPGVAHDLALGLALQVSGRYYVVASDAWPGAVVGEDGLDLSARVKGRSLRTLKVRFLREGDDEVADDEFPEPEGVTAAGGR